MFIGSILFIAFALLRTHEVWQLGDWQPLLLQLSRCAYAVQGKEEGTLSTQELLSFAGTSERITTVCSVRSS